MDEETERWGRIEGLAQAWSTLYFYHPALSVPDEAWESRLVAALPAIEAAGTPVAYADALNEHLLRHLDDPWTYAAASVDEPRDGSGAEDSPTARRLDDAVVVLDARDSAAYARPDYLDRLGAALRGVEPGETTLLILDLRWAGPPSASPWPAAFGLFLEEAIEAPGGVERQHLGWSESAASGYRENRLLRPGARIGPIGRAPSPELYHYAATNFAALPRHLGPLVVIVNDLSTGWLDDSLIALQQAGRARVVQASAGRVRLPHGSLRLWGGVELQACLYELAWRGEGVRFRPDRLVPVGDDDAAVRAARELLEGHEPPAAPFSTPLRTPSRRAAPMPPPTLDPLACEERLGGLIKLWAVLNTFFPHLGFADESWSEVIRSWGPRAEATEGTVEYYGVLLELAARLNDSHVTIWHPATEQLLGSHSPPLYLRPVMDGAAVWAPSPEAEVAGLRAGMTVTAIDGRPVAGVAASYRRYISASTPQAAALAAHRLALLGPEGTDVALTIRDGETERTVTLTRSVPRHAIPEVEERGDPARAVDSFGYIDLAWTPSAEAFEAALRRFLDLPGLILDMRGYPRFNVQFEVTNRLIDRPVESPHFHVPLRSVFERRSWQMTSYEVRPHPELRFGGPVAVLIDARAISAAEDFCIYLRNAGRVTFVGGPTRGTDGNVTMVRLPGGGRMTFTGMRVTYADGGRFQNIGIVPDILAEPTLAGLAAGRDEVLEAAIAALRQRRPPDHDEMSGEVSPPSG